MVAQGQGTTCQGLNAHVRNGMALDYDAGLYLAKEQGETLAQVARRHGVHHLSPHPDRDGVHHLSPSP